MVIFSALRFFQQNKEKYRQILEIQPKQFDNVFIKASGKVQGEEIWITHRIIFAAAIVERMFPTRKRMAAGTAPESVPNYMPPVQPAAGISLFPGTN